MSRTASVHRVTSESDVQVSLDLDGTGVSRISTGVGFYDHMLTALSRHSLIDLDVTTSGDTWVDGHHGIEDTAIAIGRGLREALGDKAGIRRFGDALVPLDEAPRPSSTSRAVLTRCAAANPSRRSPPASAGTGSCTPGR